MPGTISARTRGGQNNGHQDETSPVDDTSPTTATTQPAPSPLDGLAGFTELASAFPAFTATGGSVAPVRGPSYQDVAAQLTAPLDRSELKTRVIKDGVKEKKLDYLSHATVARHLNTIFGFGRWSSTIEELTDIGTPDGQGIPGGVRATVRLIVNFPDAAGTLYGPVAEYLDVGFSDVTRTWDKDKGEYRPRTWQAYKTACLAAPRNAFKRAAANLGEQFGLSLYPDESIPAESASASDDKAASNTDKAYVCEVCGREITGYTANSGRAYTVEDIVKFSKRDCGGRVLCGTHKREYRESLEG